MNLDLTYDLAPDVTWESRHGAGVLGGGEGSGVFVTTPPVLALLERLDRPASMRAQLGALADEYRVPADRLERDFVPVLTELEARGIVRAANGHAPAASSAPKGTERFTHLYLEMTSKCNLRCKHCYMEGGPSLANELRVGQWLALIDQFAGLGGSFLTLSGGEPLLYRGWPFLAERGAGHGLRLSLMSNGTYFDDRVLELITAHGITVGFGVDGVKPETHDYVRGRGSLRDTQAALQMMLDAGLHPLVTLCFTAMRRNVYDLPVLVERMVDLGLPRLYVSLLEDRGRAERFGERLQPTDEQRRWLLQYLYGRSRELLGVLDIEVTHHVEIFRRLLFDERDRPDAKRHGTVRVTSDGNVFMSAYMGAPEHCLGNAARSTLDEMLAGDTATRILDDWDHRVDRIPKCRSCVYRGVCRGGSGVLAYSEHGKFEEPDAYCEARISLFDALVAQSASQ